MTQISQLIESISQAADPAAVVTRLEQVLGPVPYERMQESDKMLLQAVLQKLLNDRLYACRSQPACRSGQCRCGRAGMVLAAAKKAGVPVICTQPSQLLDALLVANPSYDWTMSLEEMQSLHLDDSEIIVSLSSEFPSVRNIARRLDECIVQSEKTYNAGKDWTDYVRLQGTVFACWQVHLPGGINWYYAGDDAGVAVEVQYGSFVEVVKRELHMRRVVVRLIPPPIRDLALLLSGSSFDEIEPLIEVMAMIDGYTRQLVVGTIQ